MTAGTPLLEVRGLTTRFHSEEGVVRAVDDVSFEVRAGERFGIVGESGSGKTVTALSIMGLVDPPGRIEAGEVRLGGRDLRSLTEKQYREVRGSKITLVLQDPLSSLNPVMSIGAQLTETIGVHREVTREQATALAVELLSTVDIPRAADRLSDYPHEFSGGMRQRVGIAMALACDPDLLIADEPTTALDVTIQAQILELLKELSHERGMAVILITHDLAVMAGFAQRLMVMYAGRMMERADRDTLFYRSSHPYTRSLLESVSRLDRPRSKWLPTIPGSPPSLTHPPSGCPFHPRCFLRDGRDRCHEERPRLRSVGNVDGATDGEGGSLTACHFAEELRYGTSRPSTSPQRVPGERDGANRAEILRVVGLTKHFPVTAGAVFRRTVAEIHAVDDVSFVLHEGETLGLVGESGCGKSTVARAILRLVPPTDGQVTLRDRDIRAAGQASMRALRRDVQIIFQDPFASVNPRLTVGQIISEPLRVHGISDRKTRAGQLLEEVGLAPEHAGRYPHEFSGGQRQRIAIARALATRPELMFCDEPTSALDVSIQGQILNLMTDLQDRLGLSYVLISHDLSVIRDVADRVAVMYLGKIVESADTAQLYNQPMHPYTLALLSAVPVPDPVQEDARERIILCGEVPTPSNPPSACRFHTRCWKAQQVCRTVEPPLAELGSGHWVACHFPEQTRPAVVPSSQRPKG